MNAYQISITDAEHYGDNWTGPAPFEIESGAGTMDNWPNAPVTVHICEGTKPERAAYLLRQVADALERNGQMWLPRFDGMDFYSDCDDEKTREAYRQIVELEKQIAAIRQAVPETDIQF